MAKTSFPFRAVHPISVLNEDFWFWCDVNCGALEIHHILAIFKIWDLGTFSSTTHLSSRMKPKHTPSVFTSPTLFLYFKWKENQCMKTRGKLKGTLANRWSGQPKNQKQFSLPHSTHLQHDQSVFGCAGRIYLSFCWKLPSKGGCLVFNTLWCFI